MKFITPKHLYPSLLALLFVALIGMSITTAPAATLPVQPAAGHDKAQLDPGERNYVIDTFTIDKDSMDVLVTKSSSGPYPALKEYWQTNQNMLDAIAYATSGTSMTLSGVSFKGTTPESFVSAVQMQAAVEWGAAPAPTGQSWVYADKRTNTYVRIEFNLVGSTGDHTISSMTWYLAAPSAPRTGTYVFRDDTKYSLLYADAPALPQGYSWYGVKVYPGS